MPNSKGRKVPANRAVADRRAARQLTVSLGQPLTAASNYIGAARLMLRSDADRQIEAALLNLDKAGEQILRAGEIIRQLRSHLGEYSVDPALPSS